MTFRVTVDRDVCQAHGQCAFAAPEVFHIDGSGTLVLLTAEPDPTLRDACEDAAMVCPTQAITVED